MPAPTEWIVIVVIIMIFFGTGKLPDVLKQMGKGIREFKDAADGVDSTARQSRLSEDEEGAFEAFKKRRADRKLLKDNLG